MVRTEIPARADGTVNPGVFRPTMFLCGVNPKDSYVVYDVRPGAEIAAALLEETTDWWRSLDALPDGIVPEGVATAMAALHEAACGWSDWLTRTAPTPAPAPALEG
jgi:hypothetical protein